MLTRGEILEIVESKGLVTAIRDYIVPEEIEDSELGVAWTQAKLGLDKVMAILENEIDEQLDALLPTDDGVDY